MNYRHRKFYRDKNAPGGLAMEPAPISTEIRESCEMIEVAAGTDLEDPAVAPGSIYWVTVEAPCGEKYRVLWHKLPGGSIGCIPLEPLPMSARPIWAHGTPARCHTWHQMNEDNSKPHLTPSVHARGKWHGWFRRGRMESV